MNGVVYLHIHSAKRDQTDELKYSMGRKKGKVYNLRLLLCIELMLINLILHLLPKISVKF